jgi:hypothetical protein
MRKNLQIPLIMCAISSATLYAAGTPDIPSPSAMEALREQSQRSINQRIREEKRRAEEAERRRAQALAETLKSRNPKGSAAAETPADIFRKMVEVPSLLPVNKEKKKPGLFEAIGNWFRHTTQEDDTSLHIPKYSLAIDGMWTRDQAEFVCRDKGLHLGTKRDYLILYTKTPSSVDPRYVYWTSVKPYRGKGVIFSVPNPVQKRLFTLAPVTSKAAVTCFSDAEK